MRTYVGGWGGEAHSLLPRHADVRCRAVPERLAWCDSWVLLYSLGQHGASLRTMLRLAVRAILAPGPPGLTNDAWETHLGGPKTT